MSTQRQRDAATAGVGLGMVGTGGVLRHKALEAAYQGKKRPKVAHERVFLSRKKVPGRGRYVAGATTAFLGVPAAATGVSRLTSTSKADKSLLREGLEGAADAFTERGELLRDKPPPRLVAANYGASAGVGALAGAGTNRLARRLPGTARAGVAAVSGVGAAAASLPVQSKIIRRSSRGKYESTPVGVRLARKPSKKPQAVTKKSKDYYGANFSSGKKRAMVLAAGGPPVVGDFTSAAQAARMAPPELRGRTAALQFGGSNLGQAAGAAAGGYGAAAIARRSRKVQDKAIAAQVRVDDAKSKVTSKLPGSGQAGETAQRMRGAVSGRAARLPGAGRVRSAATRAAKPMFGHGPGVAAASALGLMGGQLVGAHAGGYAGYGRALALERKRNAKIGKRSGTSSGGGKPSKKQLRLEGERLNSRKRQQAILSTVSGGAGLAALGATIGSKGKGAPALKRRLQTAQTPLLTTSAGVGGYGSLNFAGIQRGEARQAEYTKALRPTTFRVRKPAARRGHLRVVGTAPRRTTYVRGGVG